MSSFLPGTKEALEEAMYSGFIVARSWTEITTHKMQIFQEKSHLSRDKISEEGIWTDDCKVEAIKNWLIPNMATELWSFLGFMKYYHHFVNKYAKVTHHLYNQVSGDNATQKKKKVRWTEECQVAFNVLKALCTSAPVLVCFNLPSPLNYTQMPVPWGWVPCSIRSKMGPIEW